MVRLTAGGHAGENPVAQRDRTAPRRSDLYRFGDPVNGLYATLEGDVRAFAYGGDGDRILFAGAGAGLLVRRCPFAGRSASSAPSKCARPPHATSFFCRRAPIANDGSDPAGYRAFVQLMCIHMRHMLSAAGRGAVRSPETRGRALLRLCACAWRADDGRHPARA